MVGMNVENAGVSNGYKAFVENQYSGIERNGTVEEKKKFIEAKKKIMAHPETSPQTKAILKDEIARLQLEVLEDFSNKYNRPNDTFEYSRK